MSRRRAADGVVVLGAGGHAKVVVSTLRAAGVPVAALYDDDRERWGSEVLGVPVRGPIAAAVEDEYRRAVIGLGDNRDRHRLAGEPDLAELEWLSVVHPSAWIDPSVRLGAGTVVFAGAVVQPDCQLGDHVIVNTAASIDHDCRVASFCHVAPGARLAGGVTAEEGVFLGIGSVTIPGLTIGAWAVLGAGSAAVRPVPPGATALGVPARVVKSAQREAD